MRFAFQGGGAAGGEGAAFALLLFFSLLALVGYSALPPVAEDVRDAERGAEEREDEDVEADGKEQRADQGAEGESEVSGEAEEVPLEVGGALPGLATASG